VTSDRECYAQTKAPGNVVLHWVIQNQSNEKWPKNCILKNHCHEDASVKPIIIKKRLKPGKVKEVIMNVYIPKEFLSSKVVLFFQFEDEEGQWFGQPLIGIIDIDQPVYEDALDQNSGKIQRKLSDVKSSF
jgi:hypothetical protein